MKVLRAYINGWTASFRNPLFVAGFQPTLPVPPLSTLYGLVSAARGDWVTPDDVRVGFVFQSKGIAKDLETIYEFDKSRLIAKSNVYQRQFLVEPELYLYTSSLWLRQYLERPCYPLLLGRSTELVNVTAIDELDLIETPKATYINTLMPFPTEQIYGPIQSLPTHFTHDRPRKPQGIRPFYIITNPVEYIGQSFCDPEKKWGVYLH